MKDLGKKEKTVTGIKGEIPTESEIRYPHLSLSSDILPEVEDYKGGETIEANVIMRVTSWDEEKKTGDKKVIRVGLDVEKCEVTNKKATRKKADEHGFSKKDWEEIEGKDKKENE